MSKTDRKFSNVYRYLKYVEEQLKSLSALYREHENRLFILETCYDENTANFAGANATTADRDGNSGTEHESVPRPVEDMPPGMAIPREPKQSDLEDAIRESVREGDAFSS